MLEFYKAIEKLVEQMARLGYVWTSGPAPTPTPMFPWYASPFFEVWAGPIVGVVAAFVAFLNVRKMQKQLEETRLAERVRHLVDAANYKNELLQRIVDEVHAPPSDLVDEMEAFFFKRGQWHDTTETSYKLDVQNKILMLYPTPHHVPEDKVLMFEFQSHVALLDMLLENDLDRTVKICGDPDNDVFGLRRSIVRFVSAWSHYLYLIQEAIELGYSKKAAALMLEQWEDEADAHHKAGVISDDDIRLAKKIMEAA